MESPSHLRIGRYEILAELGRGAMGVVFKARDPQLDRLVALKTVRPEGGPSRRTPADVQQRFYQEATAAGRLNHPNIVGVYDVLVGDEGPYIVMEYVEGPTLAELIARGPLPLERAVELVRQVCEALDYAHRRGVVHRDIKAGNVFVAENGVAKLADFGIARLTGQNATQTGVLMGTPGYMAPEQIRGQPADARSDLFSLGVVLYEAVTGTHPFQGPDVASVLYQVAHTDPVPARTRNPAVPPPLDAVIQCALSREPDARYADAGAFAAALAGAMCPGAEAVPWLPSGLGAARVWRRIALMGGLCVITVGSASSDSTARREMAPAPLVAATTTEPEPGRSERAAPDGHADVDPPRPEAILGEHRNRDRRPERPHRSVTPVAATAPRAPGQPAELPAASAGRQAPEATACLSVNAVPFASVYLDGQYLGDTPRACLRVGAGEHRIQFHRDEARSPELAIRVTERHTVEHPLRISYDFTAHRFREP